jgi:GNAT superfamily N-acetyltransferase
MIETPETSCVLVAENDGTPVGGLLGYITDYFFCEERVACDLAIFVEPGSGSAGAGARLIREFRNWASARAVREICLAVSTLARADAIGRLYRSLGFEPVGGVYKQRLGGKVEC